MSEHNPEPETNPLKDRIASLLYLSDSDRAQSMGALYPSWDKAPPTTRGVFMGRALAVIDGLGLTHSSDNRTHTVEGRWTE